MSSVQEHYDNLLADVYIWMSGGFEATRQRYANFFRKARLTPQGTALAVDLGAGPGFQSLPLADLGYRVLAIDTSRALLNELNARKQQRNIEVICDDMLNFPVHLSSPAHLIVCMTDTLLHLGSKAEVDTLIQHCANALQAERDRLIPVATHRAFQEAGFYRLFQPARYGGYELPIGMMVEVAGELGRGCGASVRKSSTSRRKPVGGSRNRPSRATAATTCNAGSSKTSSSSRATACRPTCCRAC